MKIPFIIEIDKIQSIDSIYLSQGEYSGILNQYLNNGEYNLYYLTYVDKYRFNIDQCEIKNNQLVINFLNTTDSVVANIGPLKIIKENSSPRNLQVKTNVGCLNLTINEVLTNWGNNINRKQEIRYIGQSKNIENRLSNHEKLINAFANVQDNQEVLLNLIKPSFGYVDQTKQEIINFDKGALNKAKFENFKYEELVDLTERILVKFYQPYLNSNFLKTNFSNDNTIQSVKGIAQNEIFIVSNQINDNGYHYHSENQNLNSSSFIIDKEGDFQDYKKINTALS
jgi:hypothetical protein